MHIENQKQSKRDLNQKKVEFNSSHFNRLSERTTAQSSVVDD